MAKLSMSADERRRLEVFSRVQSGEMKLTEASKLLGLGYRQTKRIWARYQKESDAGLVHRSRGRPSNRQPCDELKQQALALFQEHYADYAPTQAAECLAAEHGHVVAVSTLRGWLIKAGLWHGARKRKKHRSRRERRPHQGELLQMDGSYHDWFEGRRPSSSDDVPRAGWAVLMVLIDDATSFTFARFYESESWNSAVDVFQQYIQQTGLPRALYVDQHSIYRNDREPTNAEILEGKTPQTQFGRAMSELGVELILARSPQAKGRVERMNGTLQDRLVKAMRREKINDLAEANRFLADSFLAQLNVKFTKPASDLADWHRPLTPEIDLPHILSVQEQRVVQNDWTVQWKTRILQLEKETAQYVQPKQSVTLCEQLDGKLRIFSGDQELRWTPTKQTSKAKKKASRSGPTGSSQGQKPKSNHPWR